MKFTITALALLCLLVPSARAWEVSAPLTRKISDQGDYPYCSFHAVAAFLESWGNKHPRRNRPLPRLDPAYLAMAANLEASNRAFWLNYLVVVAAKHGVIPKGSLPVDKETPWPNTHWEDDHQKLIDKAKLEKIVQGKYRHRSSRRSFTGREYLDKAVGIQFEDFRWVRSKYEEPNIYDSLLEDFFNAFDFSDLGSQEKKKEEEEPEDEYRQGSFKETKAALIAEAKKLHMNPETLWLEYPELFNAILHQLYRRRPVLLSIQPDVVKGNFSEHEFIQSKNLVPYGEGYPGTHAVVAVAHCNRWDSTDPICARFSEPLKESQARDCIAIQNSWGTDSNSKGYVCLSWEALRPVLYGAVLTEYDIEKR